MRTLLLPLAAALAVACPVAAQTSCTFKKIGASCGPVLSGREKVAGGTHIVTFSVTNAPKTAPGLLVLGLKPLNFQFPGTKCYLHLDPILAFGINTDDKGKASRTFARHKDLKLTVLVQVGLEDLKHNQPLETSNALKVVCN
ncbi:MAG: hypothetical protein ACYTGW_23015 [Planctomycetota bacterium]